MTCSLILIIYKYADGNSFCCLGPKNLVDIDEKLKIKFKWHFFYFVDFVFCSKKISVVGG